jgi:hypothetical protein
MKYIHIDKEALPYACEMQLAQQTWQFEVRYNTEYDFFTVDLYQDNQMVVAGEKIVYGRPLFEMLATNKPGVSIVPLDVSGNAERVGWNELNESVFLYLLGDEDD